MLLLINSVPALRFYSLQIRHDVKYRSRFNHFNRISFAADNAIRNFQFREKLTRSSYRAVFHFCRYGTA
jgi:hypothetical protein